MEQHRDNEGHCGAMVLTRTQWAEHPRGQALAAKSVIEVIKLEASEPEPAGKGERPKEAVALFGCLSYEPESDKSQSPVLPTKFRFRQLDWEVTMF
ncbi:MAG: hypothetical protein VX745_04075 [Pseudomonadota bacterium]|nr:hypothetical protein [Pseudomonadota bacterium]